MKFDKYELIILEQNPEGDPGNLGDSFAEIFRWGVLSAFINKFEKFHELTLTIIVNRLMNAYVRLTTPTGYLRHPDAPWREDTMTSDQLWPGVVALDLWEMKSFKTEIINRISNNKWRTGNGDLISPPFLAAIKRPSALHDLALLGQIALFKLPYRWNDERRWFEKNSNSSCDYLNFFIGLIHCEMRGHTWVSRLAKKLTKPKLLREKIESYYSSEPNAFVVPLYVRAIELMWPGDQATAASSSVSKSES